MDKLKEEFEDRLEKFLREMHEAGYYLEINGAYVGKYWGFSINKEDE